MYWIEMNFSSSTSVPFYFSRWESDLPRAVLFCTSSSLESTLYHTPRCTLLQNMGAWLPGPRMTLKSFYIAFKWAKAKNFVVGAFVISNTHYVVWMMEEHAIYCSGKCLTLLQVFLVTVIGRSILWSMQTTHISFHNVGSAFVTSFNRLAEVLPWVCW